MRNECFVTSEEVGKFSKRPTDACTDKSVTVLLDVDKVFLRVFESPRKIKLDVGSDSRRCSAVLMASCPDCHSYLLGLGVFEGQCYFVFVCGIHD